MSGITHKRLIEVLDYDPATGIFRWKRSFPKRRIGEVAGSLKQTGYWGIKFDGADYLAHRLAWFYVFGVWPKRLDHSDGKKTNNRILNLREATVSQNAANKKIPNTNTSGFKGVRGRIDSAGDAYGLASRNLLSTIGGTDVTQDDFLRQLRQ